MHDFVVVFKEVFLFMIILVVIKMFEENGASVEARPDGLSHFDVSNIFVLAKHHVLWIVLVLAERKGAHFFFHNGEAVA